MSKISTSEDSEYKQLKDSAGLTAPHETPTTRLTPARIDGRRTLGRQWNMLNERDEVDEEVRRAKAREEAKRLNDRINELERTLDLERKSAQETKEDLERQLYLLKRDNEATTHSLKEEIRELEFRASRRNKEIERQRLSQLREEVLRENESFLIQQNTREQNLRRREEQLEEWNKKLNLTRIEVEKREIDVKLKEEYLRVLENRLKTRQNEVEAIVEKNPLEEVEQMITEHESDLKTFRETVHLVIEDTRRENDQNLLVRLHGLLKSTGAQNKKDGYNKWKTLFADYNNYLDEYHRVTNKEALADNYNQKTLEKIKENFRQLHDEFQSKVSRRAYRINQLNNQIKKSWVKRFDFDIVKAERIAQYLTIRSELHHKQKCTLKILQELNVLIQKLEAVEADIA